MVFVAGNVRSSSKCISGAEVGQPTRAAQSVQSRGVNSENNKTSFVSWRRQLPSFVSNRANWG
jgi:hypothetical protein